MSMSLVKDLDIDHSSIDNITMMHNDVSKDISTLITVYDGTDTFVSQEKTFHINITDQQATISDDTLLYDTNGVNGLSGNDTVIFGTDWDNHYDGINNLIDMSVLKNIEKFDLTEHGDHHIVMSAAEVTAMTDTNNDLTITTDSGDSVTLKDEGDNIWLNTGNDYTNIANSTVVHVNDSSAITIERTVPTTGDDIIGFDGSAIDAGAGSDRIVALDGITIDFSKLDNIETLDLSKSGDHDLGTLNLSDVINMTEDGASQSLTIEGDTGDAITLDVANGVVGDTNNSGDWDTVSSTGGYTTYSHTGSGTTADPTVTVKVDDDIAVTVV